MDKLTVEAQAIRNVVIGICSVFSIDLVTPYRKLFRAQPGGVGREFCILDVSVWTEDKRIHVKQNT